MIYSFCLVFKDHPRSPNWTLDFEPAFSPRFYFPLSPQSLFPTCQRFPILNHVTSGSHEPAIPFYPLVSGFPHRKFLWSRDRSRPIRSQHYRPNGRNVLLSNSNRSRTRTHGFLDANDRRCLKLHDSRTVLIEPNRINCAWKSNVI